MDDIQLARYDRVFDSYACGDEYLTRDCFTRHTQRLAELRGVTPDSPSIAAFDEELGKVWDGLAAAADTDHDGRVSRDEWRVAAQYITASLLEAREAGTEWNLEDWIGALFRVIDADGDGRITKDEYTNWLTALDLAKDTDIDAAFHGFDTNDDGYLSMEEFSATYHQFWSEFDASVPGHRWIGT